MTTRDRLARHVSRVTERTWGEAVQIVPRLASDYSAASADPDRPATTVRGIVSVEQKETDMQGSRRGTQMQGTVNIATETTHVFLRPETVTALGYAIRKDDMVVLLDRAEEDRFLVTNVATLDGLDVLLNLTKTNATPP